MQSIYNSVSSLTQLQRQLDVTGHSSTTLVNSSDTRVA